LGSRSALRALASGFGLALCLAAAPALAQEPDAGTRMAARELAVSGAEAFDKHDFVTALDRFKRAESLYKVPSISVMVARCYASVGRVVEAVDKYEETLRAPLDAAAPEAFQRAVADATAEVEIARARVARVEIHLPADAPADTVVLLDNKPVPRALLGVPTPVDPGAHRLSATVSGRARYSSELTLAEGARSTVEISLQPPSAAPEREASSAPAPNKRGISPLAIGFLTGGGLAIAAGAVTGVSALNHRSKLEAACNPGCPSSLSDELSDFRRDRTLSYLGFGVGLAAAGVGTYFLFHDSSSGTEMGALVLPGGAALRGTF
jgi:hypothetical protein